MLTDNFTYRDNILISAGNSRIVSGWTNGNASEEELGQSLKTEIISLKQTHSSIIHFQENITDKNIEGDGIILTERGKTAVIRTADCIPLSFYSEDESVAGILHVGWQGLYKKIQLRLLDLLSEKNYRTTHLKFIIGPGICGDCYEVSEEFIRNIKKIYPKAEAVRSRIKSNKHTFNLKKTIKDSLLMKNVRESSINDLNVCTKCSEHLPSYRRNRTDARILNFIAMK